MEPRPARGPTLAPLRLRCQTCPTSRSCDTTQGGCVKPRCGTRQRNSHPTKSLIQAPTGGSAVVGSNVVVAAAGKACKRAVDAVALISACWSCSVSPRRGPPGTCGNFVKGDQVSGSRGVLRMWLINNIKHRRRGPTVAHLRPCATAFAVRLVLASSFTQRSEATAYAILLRHDCAAVHLQLARASHRSWGTRI